MEKAKKAEKEGKNAKKIEKMVYQHIDATLKCWLTPKRWSTPGEYFNPVYTSVKITTILQR